MKKLHVLGTRLETPADVNVIIYVEIIPTGQKYQYSANKDVTSKFLYMNSKSDESMKSLNYLKKNSELIRDQEGIYNIPYIKK